MPGATGLDAAEELARALPDCRVLILTTFGRPGYLRRAMEGGAAGFLLKDAPAGELAVGDPPGGRRRARRRSRAGGGGARAGGEPAHPARARGAAPPPASHATVAELAERAVPVAGHRPQPPLLGDAEARRPQPGGGRAGGRGAGLAVVAVPARRRLSGPNPHSTAFGRRVWGNGPYRVRNRTLGVATRPSVQKSRCYGVALRKLHRFRRPDRCG